MTHDRPNHKWWTLFAMCFALFMIMLDNTVVNVALPKIQKDLNADPASLEWTLNAYVLTFAALILLGGKLGDRFGRKRFFIIGVVVFTVASAACALSTSDTQLIAARTLQGVGAAMLNPLSLSILVAAFPRQQLPQAIGIWAGISGLGLAIGPLLGGFLVEHVSWSAVFWINVPIGVAAAAAAVWAVVESRDPQTRTLDVVGTLLVTGGLFSLVWALIETTSHSWTSLYTLGFLGTAAVLFTLFLFWELRHPDPMVPLGLFRNRVFTVANTVVSLVGFAMFGVIFFITLYFQNVQGYSPMEAGVRSLPLTLMVLFVSPVAGKLNSKYGPRPLLTVGMTLMGLALLGLSRIEVDTAYSYIAPFYVMMGVGISMSMPSVSSAAMGAVDPRRAGIASGMVNSSRQVGGALGIAVLGSIGATRAASAWDDKTSGVAALQNAPDSLVQAVVGGRGDVVARATHSPALGHAALESFVTGVQGAMLVGSVLAFAAAAISYFGMTGTRPAPAPSAEREAAEAGVAGTPIEV
ncbi:MAG: MFS transporter [Gaiellales bacterium]|nr:MFS transporter [Gaiellales bacterium]